MSTDPQHRYLLIADDSDAKREMMCHVAKEADTGLIIVLCSTARRALSHIMEEGGQTLMALFDHDFDGETETGIDLIQALKQANPNSHSALVTAFREDSPEFQERALRAKEAGADDAVSTMMQGGRNSGDYLYALLREWREIIARSSPP